MGMVYDEAEGMPKGFGVELRRESVRLSFEHEHTGAIHADSYLGQGAYTSIEIETAALMKLLDALNTPEWSARFGAAREGYHYGPPTAMKEGREAFETGEGVQNPHMIPGLEFTYWMVGFYMAQGEALLRQRSGR